MNQTEKDRLYVLLESTIAAAPDDSPFYRAQLRRTHHEYTKEEEYGLCLSNTIGQPGYGPGDEYREFDVRLIVTAYARIAGAERDQRQTEDRRAYLLALAVAQLIDDNPSLGDDGAGCTALTRVGRLIGDVDDTLAAGQKHAVYNLYVTINHSGKRLPEPWALDEGDL